MRALLIRGRRALVKLRAVPTYGLKVLLADRSKAT
jgi:hypothetical protein